MPVPVAMVLAVTVAAVPAVPAVPATVPVRAGAVVRGAGPAAVTVVVTAEAETVGASRLLPLLVVIRDGWRVLAYAFGWPIYRATAIHLERVWIHPRARGQRWVLIQLRDKWDRICSRRGYRQMITRVQRSRPAVARLGMRRAGYIFFHEDERFLWYYRNFSLR